MEAMRALSRVKLCAAVVGWCASVRIYTARRRDIAMRFRIICFPHAID